MLVLASQSSGRLATLRAAGIDPVVRVSGLDEPAALRSLADELGHRTTPAEQVAHLAQSKVVDVTQQWIADGGQASCEFQPATMLPDGQTVLVGCDSMLEFEGQVWGKPTNAEDAVRRWRLMSGAQGTLHTGHSVVVLDENNRMVGQPHTELSQAIIHFAKVSEQEITDYVASGEPLWCAGAFTIDNLGGAFVSRIEGDHHGVVGISLPLLRTMLAQHGIVWTSLWAR
nr:nucleoside triphosphate pyrophosphatase [Actinomyces vulturis]